MLQEVIDLQNKAVTELRHKLNELNELTFKAPTGSGKTYMMADLMDRVLEERDDVIFLVSSLSKGELAKQNYNKFCEYSSNGSFRHLNTHLISTEKSSEERLIIPLDYNVYILPRDLYKEGGKLMQGVMEEFINSITLDEIFGGLNKQIYLIKDECHIATNNLDNISDSAFEKIINISATPKLSKGQSPDVEITEKEAIEARLIKVKLPTNEEDTLEDAINLFEEVKKDYLRLLGINPCLIIQISNKDKAEEEYRNKILPILNKPEHLDLKYMYIVDKDKDCDTNDELKKYPVSKWKDFVKSNLSTIDIVIFKMVISEGWDIPRACMLYQLRDSKSKQLDEQVMGRVRRNPRLLDFETLNEEAQQLAISSWIWGIQSKEDVIVRSVRLWQEPEDITNNIKVKTTRLKPLVKENDFNIRDFIDGFSNNNVYPSIFTLYRNLKSTDIKFQDECYLYSQTYQDWFKFNKHLDEIKNNYISYIANYEQSMEVVDNEGVSFPEKSIYNESPNKLTINDWVWKRSDGKEVFSFDSQAEHRWAEILKDLTKTQEDIVKTVYVGKRNKNAGNYNMFGEVESEKIDSAKKYLWGKNHLLNSSIKFEYYLDSVHTSYPDFIMKDSKDRMHIFEVKSVNEGNFNINTNEYNAKINALRQCYNHASKMTNQIFYLPILREDVWQIIRIMNGEEDLITKEQFITFVRGE